MKLVEATASVLKRLRAGDPAGTAWIDELPNIRTLGELLRLFDVHGKKVKFISVAPPRMKQLESDARQEVRR
jgi:hypothetical protein